MLISKRNDDLFLVNQVDHGTLAGEIARHWGNDGFELAESSESAQLAGEIHDEGWRQADDAPLFNESAARPLHFLEIDMSEHVPLYARGVDYAFARDDYAGLLVSMHWTGLYRARWGMQAGRVDFANDVLQDEAVAHEEQRWIGVKERLSREMRRSDLEISLWHHYDLLQAWDLLSLYLCLIDLSPTTDVAPVPAPSTLKELVQPPGPRTISDVPRRPGGERVQLTLTPVEAGVVAVDPYPFDVESIEWSVRARAIPDRRYRDVADAQETLASAGDSTISFSVVRR